MQKTYKIEELAALVDGEIIGDSSLSVSGFGSLDNARAGEMSFIAKADTENLLEKTAASVILVPMVISESTKTIIRVKNPYLASAIIQNHLLQEPFIATGIDTRAVIGENCTISDTVSIRANVVIGDRCTIGERVEIDPGVVIGDDVMLGDDCRIKGNVTIVQGCEIGSRVIVHPGTVIGSDGYGYATDERGIHTKRPQLGIVRIGDDVEIGANCCIDRATFGVTWIKSGTKIDNLVQVAHNVVVGENSLLVAQVGLAGSTILGRNVVLGGGAGASGHLSIGDGSMVAGRSAVHGDHPAGSMLAGTPAIAAKQWFRASTAFAKLPEILRDIRALKKAYTELTEQEKDKG